MCSKTPTSADKTKPLYEYFNVFPDKIEAAGQLATQVLQDAGFTEAEIENVFRKAYCYLEDDATDCRFITSSIIEAILSATCDELMDKFELDDSEECFIYPHVYADNCGEIFIVYGDEKYTHEDAKKVFAMLNESR